MLTPKDTRGRTENRQHYINETCEDEAGFIKKDDFVITHISNFRPVKKVQNIIKAFCKISRRVNAKIAACRRRPGSFWCKIIAEKLGISDKICFMGLRENIVPILNISDLYMLPSRSESFGLSALEALSCSVPVIGTKNGGLPEVVEDNVSGFLVDPDDVDLIADSALKILSDRSLKDRMSKAARQRALLFDSKIIVPQYLDYYNEIINKG